jgi:hypothetical protein
VGNKGYRRFLQTTGEHFTIDQDKLEEEERYDGKWLLTTNTELAARDVALKYKQLWMVEDILRSMKSLLETRPIYYKCDETIRGHVFCSFLALVLRRELQDRLERHGWSLEWADIIRDLDRDGRATSCAPKRREPSARSKPVACFRRRFAQRRHRESAKTRHYAHTKLATPHATVTCNLPV